MELTASPLVGMTSVDVNALRAGGTLAATFDGTDSWVQTTRLEHRGKPIFASRNDQYWALPWFDGEELIAIWILDVAYWNIRRAAHPSPPSLTVSDRILRTLAPLVRAHRVDFWGNS